MAADTPASNRKPDPLVQTPEAGAAPTVAKQDGADVGGMPRTVDTGLADSLGGTSSVAAKKAGVTEIDDGPSSADLVGPGETASPAPLGHTSSAGPAHAGDDDETPTKRREPTEPADESAAESLGRAVSETVTGTLADDSAGAPAKR